MNRPNLFQIGSVITQFFEKILQLLLLSVLWIIFSIPVITMGPASTALYATLENCVKPDKGHVVSEFLIAFKENFYKSFWVGISMLAYAALAFANLYIAVNYLNTGTFLDGVYPYISFSFFVPLILVYAYVFPVVSLYKFSAKRYLITALILAVRFFPVTILILLLSVATIVVILYAPLSGLLLPGLFALIKSYFISFTIRRMMKRAKKFNVAILHQSEREQSTQDRRS